MDEKENALLYLKPQELLEISFQWNEQTFTISECPANVFDAFISEVVGRIKNVDRQKWELYEKWRIINYCLERGALQVTTGEDGKRLLGYVPEDEPVVESIEKEVAGKGV